MRQLPTFYVRSCNSLELIGLGTGTCRKDGNERSMEQQGHKTGVTYRTKTMRFHPSDFNGKEKDYESGFHYYGARYYWSDVLTGWLSVDPMTDKYPNISPYTYCVWNPVRMIDPDGKDAEVVVNTDKKIININARIILYAASKNISGKDVTRAQAMYKNKIMDSWGKDNEGKAWTIQYNGETYTVNFNVDVTVDNQAYYESKRKYDGKTNYIGVGRINRSKVDNSNSGIWNIPSDSKNSAAHEFGHLLGLKDRYTDPIGGYSIPNPGWESNIMANSAKSVEQRNIDAIFIRDGRNLLKENMDNRGNTIGLFGSCSRPHVYRFNLTSNNREL